MDHKPTAILVQCSPANLTAGLPVFETAKGQASTVKAGPNILPVRYRRTGNTAWHPKQAVHHPPHDSRELVLEGVDIIVVVGINTYKQAATTIT
jgi:hypothetical protein